MAHVIHTCEIIAVVERKGGEDGLWGSVFQLVMVPYIYRESIHSNP